MVGPLLLDGSGQVLPETARELPTIKSAFFKIIGHPLGIGKDGLPVGVQIVGQRFREDLILDACEVIEDSVGVMAKRFKGKGLTALWHYRCYGAKEGRTWAGWDLNFDNIQISRFVFDFF